VGVFVDPIYDVILYPYLLSFGLFNNIILGFLIILFDFVDNKSDQASTAKKDKKRVKRGETGFARRG